jgi:hypothetical protein
MKAARHTLQPTVQHCFHPNLQLPPPAAAAAVAATAAANSQSGLTFGRSLPHCIPPYCCPSTTEIAQVPPAAAVLATATDDDAIHNIAQHMLHDVAQLLTLRPSSVTLYPTLLRLPALML